jgi:hypothetical protein
MATSTSSSLRDQLRELTTAVGRPITTVYLPLPSATEDAAQQFDIRRRNLPGELADAGADDATVEVIERALADREHGDGAALVLVADAERVLVDRTLTRPIDRPLIRVGPAPALLPALRAEQDDIDHVAVLLDRTGADLWVRSGLGDSEQTARVKGDTEHVARSHPGGWSQRRFQQRAEETWEQNAKAAVDELAELVDLERVEHVVVGGEIHSVSHFTENLPPPVRDRVLEVDGSRHAEHDAFLDAADTAIRTASKQDEVADIRQLREELAVDVAQEGLGVLSMLAQGRVERLFVVDDTEAEERIEVAFTTDPLLAGEMAEEVSADQRGPAADLAVLMAEQMGTDIHVLPSHGARLPERGLGARLRG